jgi:hydroxyethylthiazole kinase-like uncharacterized protein yjeF
MLVIAAVVFACAYNFRRSTKNEITGQALWLGLTCMFILMGIGTVGEAREPIASCISRINRSGKPVVAADIPSGLDGDTGVPRGEAVNATRTVTFGLAKHGCLSDRARPYVGELLVDGITIPLKCLLDPESFPVSP